MLAVSYVEAFAIVVALLAICLSAVTVSRTSRHSAKPLPVDASLPLLRASLEALESRVAEQHATLQRLIARERTAGARAAKLKDSVPDEETPDQWRERMNRELATRRMGVKP